MTIIKASEQITQSMQGNPQIQKDQSMQKESSTSRISVDPLAENTLSGYFQNNSECISMMRRAAMVLNTSL
jgi:hypothetical protein